MSPTQKRTRAYHAGGSNRVGSHGAKSPAGAPLKIKPKTVGRKATNASGRSSSPPAQKGKQLAHVHVKPTHHPDPHTNLKSRDNKALRFFRTFQQNKKPIDNQQIIIGKNNTAKIDNHYTIKSGRPILAIHATVNPKATQRQSYGTAGLPPRVVKIPKTKSAPVAHHFDSPKLKRASLDGYKLNQKKFESDVQFGQAMVDQMHGYSSRWATLHHNDSLKALGKGIAKRAQARKLHGKHGLEGRIRYNNDVIGEMKKRALKEIEAKAHNSNKPWFYLTRRSD